jgi:hypothetical protein
MPPALHTLTVTVWPGSPEPLCRTLLVTSSLSGHPAAQAGISHSESPRMRASHGLSTGSCQHLILVALTRAIDMPTDARYQHRFSTRPGNDGK